MGNLAEQEKLYTEEEYYAAELPARTELIDWKIYCLASPSTRHQDILAGLSSEIRSYIKRNKGKCKMFVAPSDVKLADGVIVQPDIYVTCDRSRIDEQKHNGAPEWVIEIVSPSSAQHDYAEKFRLYREYGVKEYWIIDPRYSDVIVYLFGESETVKTYKFSENITAELYRTAPEPLVLCVDELEY